jgi:signal transduction histidine kinase
MAIVKKIMDLHNGEIEIESVPDSGTVVRLVIPRVMPGVPAAIG